VSVTSPEWSPDDVHLERATDTVPGYIVLHVPTGLITFVSDSQILKVIGDTEAGALSALPSRRIRAAAASLARQITDGDI